jgi:phosphoribosylanthranilate isomerase
MFRVKICGITTPADAALSVAAGADALGLNFYPASPRSIGLDQAVSICSAVPPGVVKVGVFVNAAIEHVIDTFDRLRLDLIQVHGDESPEYLTQLAGRPVMRAFRMRADGGGLFHDYLARSRALDCAPRMALIDAWQAGVYGGTGSSADWNAVRALASHRDVPPLVLAGGLTPENVASAIASARPVAVDTASGVESSPGRKSPDKVAAFVSNALAEFRRLGL